MRIILGSKSPRRKELLSMLGYQFIVKPSEVSEDVEENDAIKKVLAIAKKKADAIIKEYHDDLIICADTIVVCNNEIIGKPKDHEDAKRMITLLQGNSHFVYTAVVCNYKDNKRVEFVEETKVYITKMTDEEINEYITTNEPYDKAGGYGIQGVFGKFIERIEGDFYNVVGLPLCKLHKVLKELVNNK